MSDLSRVEQLLRNALGEDVYEVTPQSRVEVLLAELNELIEGMGGGSVSPEDIATAVAAYLDEHLTNPTSPPVDTSLAIAGAAADAKKTGDEISQLKEDLTQLSAQIRVIAARDDSWRAIKENIKMGFGELLYPVGMEFEVECPSGAPYNSIIFVVVDHRVENNEHIMTMLMKHVIYGMEFDAPKPLYAPKKQCRRERTTSHF